MARNLRTYVLAATLPFTSSKGPHQFHTRQRLDGRKHFKFPPAWTHTDNSSGDLLKGCHRKRERQAGFVPCLPSCHESRGQSAHKHGCCSDTLSRRGSVTTVTGVERRFHRSGDIIIDESKAVAARQCCKRAIPMKMIGDSDWIPVTGSEMKLMVFGAKRRWHSYPA